MVGIGFAVGAQPRTAGRGGRRWLRRRVGGRLRRRDCRRSHARSASHGAARAAPSHRRSEEHTSELQSRQYLVCRLLLEKKKKKKIKHAPQTITTHNPTS